MLEINYYYYNETSPQVRSNRLFVKKKSKIKSNESKLLNGTVINIIAIESWFDTYNKLITKETKAKNVV